MAWITPQRVEALLQRDLSDDDYIGELIDHAQGRAEVVIGTQTEPVSNKLQAVLGDIVARMWRDGQMAQANPAGFQQETTGPFGMQAPQANGAGLGLTNREKEDLRAAVGKTGLWVQPTSRADRLETGPSEELEDATDPIDTLAAAQVDLGQHR